jgi:hypothetical protein
MGILGKYIGAYPPDIPTHQLAVIETYVQQLVIGTTAGAKVRARWLAGMREAGVCVWGGALLALALGRAVGMQGGARAGPGPTPAP